MCREKLKILAVRSTLNHAFLDNLRPLEISILLVEIHLQPSKLELSVGDTPIEAPRQLLCSDPKEEVQDFRQGMSKALLISLPGSV